MGEVYLAKDTVLGRNVALKLLRAETLADPLGKVRFLREARAIAALNHPNIAVLYEAGGSEEAPFLAMEFVAGKTLREVVADGPLPSERIVEYGMQIASGLEHAHAQGILHRDIKSANILLTPQGTIKLLDFGLAKIAEPGEETRSLLTAQGSWVGTMQYCPPEILFGNEATVRSDLYSLGVVIYEMACGKLPFAGLESAALLNAISRGGATEARKKNPAIPAALSAAIERAMATRPEDRFANAGELRAALQGSLHAAEKEQRKGGQQTLVVLQFQNISGDSSVEWLGTGIAETLRTDLKKLEFVRVVSRERVQSLMRADGGENADGIAVAKNLGAQLVVDGSYQRSGDRLRITPRLLEVETGEVLATHKLDGTWEDVFSLQDRVVNEISSSMRGRLHTETLMPIVSPETRHLKAYEHYAMGRKVFNQYGKDSLEQAREEFAAAVALDPSYAVAHSGLGRTYAMRFIHRTDPEDLSTARGHLERALELDRELGEPYAWLSYVLMRQGKVQQALEAARKSAEKEPDVYYAHYMLGATHLVNSERQPEDLQHSARALLESLKLEPRYEFSWAILGEIALLVGDYDAAEDFLDRGVALGNEKDSAGRFIGSGVLRATVWLRRGEYQKAREGYQQAIEFMSKRDHMYREAYLSMGACGLGDTAMRAGSPAAALIDYQRAFRITKEFPRMLGLQRVQARTLAGLAGASALQGDSARAKQHLAAADEKVKELVHQPQSWIWHGGLPFLYYGLAVAHVAMGTAELALEPLEQAARAGWRDVQFLEMDPAIASLRSDSRFEGMCERLRRIPKVDFSRERMEASLGRVAS